MAHYPLIIPPAEDNLIYDKFPTRFLNLNPPTFPQGNGGNIIPIQSIQALGELIVFIPVITNLRGNELIFLWWNDVILDVYEVTEFQDFPIRMSISASNAPLGVYQAYYEVYDFANPSVSSPIVSVQVSLTVPIPGTQLQMILTTNASNYDWDAINVRPFNRGVVTGVAGTPIHVAISAPGLIGESGRNNIQLVIGMNNQADFSIYSTEQGLLTVNAYEITNPANIATLFPIFGPYRLGTGAIKSVNYSTGAPANGRTYNSIYLKTEAFSSAPVRPITYVRAIITSGSARIVGYAGQFADILLNGDQSATIDFTNLVSERTVVELSLPEQSGSVKNIEFDFVVPSPTPNLLIESPSNYEYQG